MKILIDTNVLLSAALRERLPERVVLFVAERDDLRRIVTPDIQAEYSDVLRRPKFAMDDETLDQWNTLLAMRAIDVGQPPQSRQFPRDPEDAPFLAAALSADADYMITGDTRTFWTIETSFRHALSPLLSSPPSSESHNCQNGQD